MGKITLFDKSVYCLNDTVENLVKFYYHEIVAYSNVVNPKTLGHAASYMHALPNL